MGVSGSDGLNGRKRGRVVTERENESNEGRREEGLKAEREGRRSTVELQSRRKPLQTNSDVCLTHIQLVLGMLLLRFPSSACVRERLCE